MCRPHNISHRSLCGLAAAVTHHFVGLWRVFGLKSCRQRVLLMVWREDAWTLDGFRESGRGSWISTVDASQTVGLARFSRTKPSVRSLSCCLPEHQTPFDWLLALCSFENFLGSKGASKTVSHFQWRCNCRCCCVVAAQRAKIHDGKCSNAAKLCLAPSLWDPLAFGAIAGS